MEVLTVEMEPTFSRATRRLNGKDEAKSGTETWGDPKALEPSLKRCTSSIFSLLFRFSPQGISAQSLCFFLGGFFFFASLEFSQWLDARE